MGGHSSGGLFPGTIGQLADENSDDLFIEIRADEIGGNELLNPILGATRVGSALKNDSHHGFPDIVDNWVGYARDFTIAGGDGKLRMLYQLAGSLNGVPGIFEWIVDPAANTVTHRRFIKKGRITGRPNQRPGKDEENGGVSF